MITKNMNDLKDEQVVEFEKKEAKKTIYENQIGNSDMALTRKEIMELRGWK
jgi:hypothetical protein